MLKKVEKLSEEQQFKLDFPCYGNFPNCKCGYYDSCKLKTESDQQIKADDVHSNIENIEYDQEIGDKNQEDLKDEVLDTVEPPVISEDQIYGFYDENKNFIEVDLKLIPSKFWSFIFNWIADNPRTAKALSAKIFGECKNVAEIAEQLGISRQAMSLSLANELGVGKKKIPETKILGKCTPRERDVYECIVMRGLSQRQTAKELNIHYRQVLRCLHYLRRKKIEVSALKNDKTKK